MTVDYTAAVTGITTQLTSALSAGLPIWGTILGVVVSRPSRARGLKQTKCKH